MRSIADIVDFAIGEHEEYKRSYDYDHPFHTALWDFTRAVKSYFAEDADPDHVFRMIQPEVIRRGGWSIFEDPMGETLSSEEAYLEFVYNWRKIRCPGSNPLGEAHRRASESPLFVAASGEEQRRKYNQFVSIAGWLQVIMEDHPITLPCGKLGELLGVSAMTITRMRSLAKDEGYIEEVREHSRAQHRATEFRFDVSQFPVLAEESPEAG